MLIRKKNWLELKLESCLARCQFTLAYIRLKIDKLLVSYDVSSLETKSCHVHHV